MIRWAVFVSGEGTNLQNVLNLEKAGKIPNQEVVFVHADRACRALERAEIEGKHGWIKSPKDPHYDQSLLEQLENYQVDRIFLLGFMRILSKNFLLSWGKPVVNLHPSLLPKYKGLRAAERAFEAGDSQLGVSLHEVVEELDSGEIIRQVAFPRDFNENFERVFERIRSAERKIVEDYLISLESLDSSPIG